MGFIKDFKEFAMKGNIVDMAVGVIIGGAFGQIVSSLVNDIIMPVVGLATGGVDFKKLDFILKSTPKLGEDGQPILDQAGKVVNEVVTLNYGMFIQNIVDFLIIALSIFFALKVIMKFKKKEKEEAAAPAPAPEPTKEEVLLTEIRDLLAKSNGVDLKKK